MQAIQQDWGLVQSFWITEKNREVLILQEAEQLRAELRLRVTSGSRTGRGLEMVVLEETENT